MPLAALAAGDVSAQCSAADILPSGPELPLATALSWTSCKACFVTAVDALVSQLTNTAHEQDWPGGIRSKHKARQGPCVYMRCAGAAG